MRIRTLIVDDESIARQGLRSMLDPEPDIEVVGEAATGEAAVAAILELEPALVFLDIRMPDLDGFGVLERIERDRRPVVVFVTAYDDQAVRAFDVAALDYVVKPFGQRRLREALDRARSRIREGAALAAGDAFARAVDALRAGGGGGGQRPATRGGPGQDRASSRLKVRSGNRSVLLDAAEIEWIEAADDYVRVHAGGGRYLLDERLGALGARLDDRFVRIHRSTIVNTDRIRSLYHRSHGDWMAVLRDGTELKVSRTRRTDLERVIGPIG